MRILIFHGYLLRGTGSNVYNASLAEALARLGHEVHLLSQEPDAASFGWVDGIGFWRDGTLEIEQVNATTHAGSVTVHRPEIGRVLPVYVNDRYEGFDVKTYPELTAAELDRYLDANVRAVNDVTEFVGMSDAALANHLIMGPAILARAQLSFAIKVHGSDLSYTVRPHPDRFVPYAREGVDAAAGILVGSSHTAADLFATLGDGGLEARTRLGPPGVDVRRFRARSHTEALAALDGLANRLSGERGRESFGRDGGGAAEALREWGQGRPRVLFVGKLLANKGVDLLLAAWPLVHRAHPGARLLFAGFGGFRAGLEALAESLAGGDLEQAARLAARGRELEGAAPQPLEILASFLARPPEGYAEAARAAAGSVAISGRLEHGEVAEVMPAADALVMPSTFPEAFGMVAAEAAACGVPPLSADHSGMREVSRLLAGAVGPQLAPLLSFHVGPGAVEEIASRLHGWLALDPTERDRAGRALSARVAELWSWDSVAEGVIAASQGDLDALPAVVTGEPG